MKILFFGSDAFAIPSLQILATSSHKILAVVSQPDKPAGRGQKLSACPAAIAAETLHLKKMQPATLKEEKSVAELLALKPDLLVVVAYGKFLPHSLIEAIPCKAVNLHPSLLPKYRGASPIQSAILNGDTITGVTTMTITEEMDAGDIYLQAQTKIEETETAQDLYQRLGELGAELLLKTLEGLEKKTLKAKPQDPSKVVRTTKFTKEDGHLHWQESAEVLYRKIRALNPWPGTFCYLGDKILKIFEAAPLAHLADQKEAAKGKTGVVVGNKQAITVACGQGYLSLLEVQLEGKKRMSAAEFLKGHPVDIGMILK